MTRPANLTFATTLASLALATVSAASKPPPEIDRIPSVPSRGAGDACVLGYSAATVYIVHFVLPPDDTYLTLLEPDSCNLAGARLITAHARLYFQVPCTQTFAVRIVGATGDSCRVPDPGRILCGPIMVDYSPPAAPGIFDVSFELPEGCLITEPAFLSVTFVDLEPECSSIGDRPALVTSDECRRCASYNFYPNNQVDLCDFAIPGRPIMYVDAESAVPVVRSTWGALRTRYR